MHARCARAATAAEARFRVDAPNALPRRTAVIALDPEARAALREVAAAGPRRAVFLDAPGAQPASLSPGWLQEVTGHARAVAEVIEAADVLVMVGTAGAPLADAALIGEAVAAAGKQAAALLLDAGAVPAAALSESLRRLRPHAGMLVVADGRDYVEAMLDALRA